MLQMYVYAIFGGLLNAWIQSSEGIMYPEGWCFVSNRGRTALIYIPQWTVTDVDF